MKADIEKGIYILSKIQMQFGGKFIPQKKTSPAPQIIPLKSILNPSKPLQSFMSDVDDNSISNSTKETNAKKDTDNKAIFSQMARTHRNQVTRGIRKEADKYNANPARQNDKVHIK